MGEHDFYNTNLVTKVVVERKFSFQLKVIPQNSCGDHRGLKL